MAKANSSATASLMRIALGIDLALLFFGVLTLRGLQVVSTTELWLGSAVALVIVLVLLGTVDRPAAVWLGHLFHLSLLGLFVIDPAVGLSTLVPIGFWVYASVRGPQLDALHPGDQDT